MFHHSEQTNFSVACSFLKMPPLIDWPGLGFHLLLQLQSGGLSSLVPPVYGNDRFVKMLQKSTTKFLCLRACLIKAQGLGQEWTESNPSDDSSDHPGLFHAQVNLSTSRDRAVLQKEQAAATPHLKRYAAVLAKVWELILVQL